MRPLPLLPPLNTCRPSGCMDNQRCPRPPQTHTVTPTRPPQNRTATRAPQTQNAPPTLTPTRAQTQNMTPTLTPTRAQTHPPLQPNGQQGGRPLGRSQPTPSPNTPLLSEACSMSSLAQAEELFDLIASSQSRRLDDQRASIGDRLAFTIAQNNIRHLCEACNPQEPTDDFFNMLITHQSCRLNDQRCSLPECVSGGAASDPDEAFFSLIQRVQAKRMDEQRVSFYCDQHDPDHDPSSRPAGSGSS
ncbi:hypothetical protein ACEWY4_012138 [Coilia grayii]|uniref:Uncharacterized protein n=1 Tax=Coilia grayii TaxID=363190 RepID=A0ABD1JZS7_9TELE